MFEEVPGRTPVSQDALADGQKDEMILKAAREMFPDLNQFENDDDRVFAYLCEVAQSYSRISRDAGSDSERDIAVDLDAVLENIAPEYTVAIRGEDRSALQGV